MVHRDAHFTIRFTPLPHGVWWIEKRPCPRPLGSQNVVWGFRVAMDLGPHNVARQPILRIFCLRDKARWLDLGFFFNVPLYSIGWRKYSKDWKLATLHSICTAHRLSSGSPLWRKSVNGKRKLRKVHSSARRFLSSPFYCFGVLSLFPSFPLDFLLRHPSWWVGLRHIRSMDHTAFKWGYNSALRINSCFRLNCTNNVPFEMRMFHEF